MSDQSKIEWTDATVNFWWGCTKVGPGCDHCYAETLNNFRGNKQWGPGAERRKIKGAASLIRRLDNGYAEWAADYYVITGNARAFGQPTPMIGPRRRVFIQSMSDLFDLEVPLEWFGEAWGHIESCRRLEIQIVTKRVSAVLKRLAAIGRTAWPKHAGLIITVVNQTEAERDIPRLLALKGELGIPWVGLSIEPMLGPITFRWAAWEPLKASGATNHLDGLRRLDWIICGGESGPHARPMHPDWARSLRDQCAAAGVPFLFKQHGEWIGVPDLRSLPGAGGPGFGTYDSRPYDAEHESVRVGKHAAGRLLDGVEHNGYPVVSA